MARPLRILILEDQPAEAELELRELRRTGFDPEATIVATEPDFRAGLERELDLVLSDFSLPGFDGLSALRILRKRDPELPFIIVTGVLDDEQAARAMSEGASDYVLKDRMARLGPAVENALEARRAREEKRRADEALARSELYRRLIFENTQDLLLILNADGRPRFYSPSVLTTFGRTPEDVEERSVFELVHPEDRERTTAEFAEALKNPETALTVQFRMSHADGSWRTVEALGKSIVESESGGIVVSARDVTERIALEESRNRLVYDLNERVKELTTIHRTARLLQDRERSDADVLAELVSFLPAAWQFPEIAAVRCVFDDVVRASAGFRETPWMLRREFRLSDGTEGRIEVAYLEERPPAFEGPFFEEECDLVDSLAEMLRSHFERKRGELALARARDEALAASRLKSSFLANMSHEIRTPLNVIVGYSSLMTESAEMGSEKVAELAEGIEQASQRLIGTMHSVLDIARLETGDLEVRPVALRLRPLVERVVDDRRTAGAKKGLDLACELEEPDATVVFDEYCLEHALANLVDNAVKFTTRGTVTVRLRRDRDGTLLLEVEDTGIGIAEDYLPRLFEPFSQEEAGSARQYEGNGLGLALTKRYLGLGGATVSARSEKGRGSTFTIRLPRELEEGGGARSGSEARAQRPVAEDRQTLSRQEALTRAELEERVAERTAQLEAVNRELEAFAYSVSHDLRAPLRAIDGFGQALVEDCGDNLDENGRHYLERVREATRKMSDLIDGLLTLSRLGRRSMTIGPVDLGAMAREIAGELERLEPDRNVEFSAADPVRAEGDPDLLRVVLWNLLGNAWKFTIVASKPRIELGVEERDDEERIYFVRDNGAGFDMRYADKLFAPFQRLHSPADFPGGGLGLATVQRIVARHGGTVWAEGEVGSGATFRFTLPGRPMGDTPLRPSPAVGRSG